MLPPGAVLLQVTLKESESEFVESVVRSNVLFQRTARVDKCGRTAEALARPLAKSSTRYALRCVFRDASVRVTGPFSTAADASGGHNVLADAAECCSSQTCSVETWH